jgi:hypothetical protein
LLFIASGRSFISYGFITELNHVIKGGKGDENIIGSKSHHGSLSYCFAGHNGPWSGSSGADQPRWRKVQSDADKTDLDG